MDGAVRRGVAVLVAGAVLAARVAAAANHLIALHEVLGSWQGDAGVQFVELRMLAAGQRFLAFGGGADLIFDDATASADGRRIFAFTTDVANGLTNGRILVASEALAALAGVEADFVLPPGFLAPRDGRVCYRVNPPQPEGQATGVIDCVAYGHFTGPNGSFGPPTPITPDNRSLQRIATTGRNADDWEGEVNPTPENNAGAGFALPTLCGDGVINQGEECDGAALGGATCATLGFARGRLRCEQCHLDAGKCTSCGNDAINEREECDGTDLGGRTCETLGFTGGQLDCTDSCRLSTRNCDPTFFVPGGGPRGPECLAAWLVTNATGRPGGNGKARVAQRCKDGDGGCDAEPAAGTCAFTVAVCLDREDARLARKHGPCKRSTIGSWTLRRPAPAAEGPGAAAAQLVAAVAALGPSTVDGGTVDFQPPLDATERCTASVQVRVPTRGKRPGRLLLRSRTKGTGAGLTDNDRLKLLCLP